jgi:hypothetical protein
MVESRRKSCVTRFSLTTAQLGQILAGSDVGLDKMKPGDVEEVAHGGEKGEGGGLSSGRPE